MPAQNNVSSWTGKRQVVASGRGWWEATVTLPPIVGTSTFNAWRAFLALSRGAANDFQVPVDATAQYAFVGSISTDVADQTGRSISTNGWPNSTTTLVAGQFVTIQNQLFQLTANVTSNGSGVAVLSVEPPVRTPIPVNAAVEYRNPYCLMYLTEMPSYSVEPGYVYSLTLDLRESF
jgi:hypothetical protein